MAEKRRITNPSMGSNPLGEETNEIRGSGISTGTDTQTQIAAISAQRKKEKDAKSKKANEPILKESKASRK